MSNDEYDDKWVDSDVDSERYEVPEGDYILELLEKDSMDDDIGEEGSLSDVNIFIIQF